MKYITIKRLKGKCLAGEVNIPALTPIEEKDGILFYDDKPICLNTSRQAHEHFSCNIDGLGLQRGELIQKIEKLVQGSTRAFDKLKNNELCKRYKKDSDQLVWFWSHDFYNASIEDLEQIYKEVK